MKLKIPIYYITITLAKFKRNKMQNQILSKRSGSCYLNQTLFCLCVIWSNVEKELLVRLQSGAAGKDTASSYYDCGIGPRNVKERERKKIILWGKNLFCFSLFFFFFFF